MCTLISMETVKEKIDTAEETLHKCFSMLMDIKNATDALGDAIMDFQPLLSDCLYELMGFYQKLQAEKRLYNITKKHMGPGNIQELNNNKCKILKSCQRNHHNRKDIGRCFFMVFLLKKPPRARYAF